MDWNVLSAVATAVAAIAAAVSALLSYLTVSATKQSAKETAAAQAIGQYAYLNLRFPEHSAIAKWQEYSNFVLSVVLMARAVLDAYPDSKKWRAFLGEHLGYHNEELAAWIKEPGFGERYGHDLLALIQEVAVLK